MPQLLLTILSAFFLSLGLTKFYIDWANAKKRLDVPNERSSHSHPVPVGGGIVIVVVTVILWACLSWPLQSTHLFLLMSFLALALISWIDDRVPLPWTVRLAVQIVSVGLVLSCIPQDQHVLPIEIPLAMDRIVTALAWIWFINLFNFMDGMDGLAATEAVTIILGVILIYLALGRETPMLPTLFAALGATLAFLRWNWHQAKVFMGDVGSIPLGLLLGWLLIDLSINGHFAAAIILPLYFLADATITLCRRVLNREAPWKPHKTHFYQRAHQGGHPHDRVVSPILIANGILIAAALMSLHWPWAMSALGGITVTSLLFVLRKMAISK